MLKEGLTAWKNSDHLNNINASEDFGNVILR